MLSAVWFPRVIVCVESSCRMIPESACPCDACDVRPTVSPGSCDWCYALVCQTYCSVHPSTSRCLDVSLFGAGSSLLSIDAFLALYKFASGSMRCVQMHAVQHLAGTPSLSDGTGAQLFLRVAFDILMVHGTQLACLRQPPTQIVALDNFLQLIGLLIAHESIEKATHFAKSMIFAAVEACRDACRRRKGALLTRPLHRIFIGIVNELLALDRVPLYIGLDALAHGLRHLEPRAYPAFSFSWLEILAHRKVMVPMVSVRSLPAAGSFKEDSAVRLRLLQVVYRVLCMLHAL